MIYLLLKILGLALLVLAGVAARVIAFVAWVSGLSDELGTADDDSNGGRGDQ